MARHYKELYGEVRQQAPQMYIEVIQSATTLGANHNLDLKVTSEIEWSMMKLVHTAMKLDIVRPKK